MNLFLLYLIESEGGWYCFIWKWYSLMGIKRFIVCFYFLNFNFVLWGLLNWNTLIGIKGISWRLGGQVNSLISVDINGGSYFETKHIMLRHGCKYRRWLVLFAEQLNSFELKKYFCWTQWGLLNWKKWLCEKAYPRLYRWKGYLTISRLAK